jgi:hypothetical protein
MRPLNLSHLGITDPKCGNHEPHRRYSHQKSETDYAKRHGVIRVVYMDVQREAREQPKPTGQSKRHEHRYANEMFRQHLDWSESNLRWNFQVLRKSSTYEMFH